MALYELYKYNNAADNITTVTIVYINANPFLFISLPTFSNIILSIFIEKINHYWLNYIYYL